MAMGRPEAVLVLEVELREQLEGFANSRSLPAGLVRQAKMILLSASGKTNREIAQQLGTTYVTVGWCGAVFCKAEFRDSMTAYALAGHVQSATHA